MAVTDKKKKKKSRIIKMKGNIILQVLHFINEKLRTKELMKLA